MQILNICDQLVDLAKKHEVDVDIMAKSCNSTSFSCRNLKPESVIFADEMNITFRVMKDRKCVTMVTTDEAELPELMLKAINIIPKIIEDPFIRIISKNEIQSISYLQDKKEQKIPSIDFLKEKAFITEEHALKQDKVKNVGEVCCKFSKEHIALATSSGFKGYYNNDKFSLSIEVITETEEKNYEMSSGYDYSIAGCAEDLKDPILLAESAAMRSRWGLGAKKISSCIVPVIFEKRVANDILESLIEAINGDTVSKQMSFLKNSLNKKICSDKISIIDNPIKKDSVYFVPFDGEGFATKKLYCVNDGILNSWILDIHSATKLGLQSTGHAYRSTNGVIKPEIYNLHLETKDKITKESMISDVKNGLYVTEAFSFGYNSTNGDYSKGVSGFWIENGKLTYPVNEITVASNLNAMLSSMIAADDISFDYQINSPTIFIPKMTVSGK